MSFKKVFGFVSMATIVSVSGYGVGCSATVTNPIDTSDSGNPGHPDGATQDHFVPPFDSGPVPDSGPPASCDPTKTACCDGTSTFTPVPWVAPAAFTASCSTAQLNAYAGSGTGCLVSGTGDCTAFRADAANTACVACLETQVTATASGPIVIQGSGASLNILEVNWGGCIAHFDNATSATGCGAKFDDFNNCFINDCGGCSDLSSNPPGPLTVACEKSAFGAAGTCSSHKITQACDAEINGDGGVALSCGPQLIDLITTWCGGGASDAGGGG